MATLPQAQSATFVAPGSIPATGLLTAPLAAPATAAYALPPSVLPGATAASLYGAGGSQVEGFGVEPTTGLEVPVGGGAVVTTTAPGRSGYSTPKTWKDWLKWALGAALVGSVAYRLLYNRWPFQEKIKGSIQDAEDAYHDFRERRRRRKENERLEERGDYGPGTCGEGQGVRRGGGAQAVREDICAGRSAKDEHYDSDASSSESSSDSDSDDDENTKEGYSRIHRRNQRPIDKMSQLLHIGGSEKLCDKLPDYAAVLSPDKRAGVVLTPSGRLKFLLKRYDACGFPVRSKGLKGYQELIDLRQDEKAFADGEATRSGRNLRRDRAIWALVRFTRDGAGEEGPSKIYIVGGPTNQRKRIFNGRGRQPLPLGAVMEVARGGPTSSQISDNELLPPVLRLNNDGILSLFWDSGKAKGGETFNVELDSIYPAAPAPFEEGVAYACPNPPPDSDDYKAPREDVVNGGRVYLIEHGTKRWLDPKAFEERAGGNFVPVDCAALDRVPMGPRLHSEQGDV